MRRVLRRFRLTLLAAAGVLVMGLGAYAQDAGVELVTEPAGQEATAESDGLWEKLEELKASLDASAVAAADDIAAVAQRATELLLGSDTETGVIGLVQELAGMEDYIDAEAVIAAGTDAPEVIALAHLVLAAQLVADAPDATALIEAGGHVLEADTLLAHLKPVPAASE